MAGILYIVGTPIGNLQDITLRAIEVLGNVDVIACEDTRHTKILLDRYKIKTSTTSYHKFNITTKNKTLIASLLSGKDIALVSDAGMPGVSDPGQEIVKAAVEEGIKVEVIPGPCAAVSALAVSGLNTDKFVFEGFLPAKQVERVKRLSALSAEERTIILYEAPHRIKETLNDIKDAIGDRPIAIVRELTKKFEEIKRGKVSEILKMDSALKLKGEFVVIIEGAKPEKVEIAGIRSLMREMVEAGLTKSDSVKIISKNLGIPRNELYSMALEI